MQLKVRVNSMAKEAGIPAQALMQSYLLERILERLSRSKWRNNVIIKGGVLISSLVGVRSRTTMDLDTTVRGFALTHESAERAFRDIERCKQTMTGSSSLTGQRTFERPMSTRVFVCT